MRNDDPGATRVDEGTPSPTDGTVPVSDHRFSRGASGFESEINTYLQSRLRLGTLVIGTASLFLLVVGRFVRSMDQGALTIELHHPSVLTNLAATVVMFVLWAMVRSNRLRGVGLLVIDCALAETCIAASVLILAFSYRTGIHHVIPLLGVALIARAVLVPSTARRTLLLSLPALPAVAAVQLAHGQSFDYDGNAIIGGAFRSVVIWDAATLVLCITVATLASRVNFALRVRAWESRQIDRYTLEEKIGEGAMGEVYRAHHGMMQRPTAIKMLRPEITGEDALRRFEHEVKQTARLTHPNTIAIYDYGTTDDGAFYYAMELMEGRDLDDVVRLTGPFAPSRTIHVLAQACAALQEAHGIGLIHRDVKPANLMLCRRGGEDDVVKVMDFGLVADTGAAGATRGKTMTGTPLTMAPETIRGHSITHAVDVYAMGAVGCFLLTGKPIFDLEKVAQFVVAHLNRAPIPPSQRDPSIPADLENVLMRCLEKDPADRFPDAGALRNALLACESAGTWTCADAAQWWQTNEGLLR